MKTHPQTPHTPKTKRSFALVITLLIITLLTFTAVAFFTSSQIERTNSRATFNATQATLAAQAGVTIAQETLRRLITQYPDSVTKFEPRLADRPGTPGTALIYKTVLPTNPQSHATPYQYLPLISGATPIQLTNPNARQSAIPNLPTVDLNAPSLNPDRAPNAGGWITGNLNLTTLSPDYASNEIRVPWVNITPEGSNTPIARYAYWIEDESFKYNPNTAPSETVTRTVGTDARFIAATTGIGHYLTGNVRGKQIITHTGFPIELLSSLTPSTTISDTNLRNLAQDRLNLLNSSNIDLPGFPSQASLWHFASQKGYVTKPQAQAAHLESKFLTTANSFSMNVSRLGAPRMNINTIVNPYNNPEYLENNTSLIANRLKQIAAHIMYNTTGTALNTSHPYFFGRRFDSSRTQPLNPIYATNYFKRLVVNIHDQIAGWNNMPTALKQSTNLYANASDLLRTKQDYINASPIFPPPSNSSNPILAIGKRALPYITEVVMHAIQRGNPGPYNFNNPQPGGDYDLKVNYYIEFWNPYDWPVSFQAKKNPKLIIENTPAWRDVGDKSIDLPVGSFDAVFDLANITFPPNSVTVITNAAQSEYPTGLIKGGTVKNLIPKFPNNPYPVSGIPGLVSTKNSSPPLPKLAVNPSGDIYLRLPTLRLETRDSDPGINSGKDSQTRLFITNDDGVMGYYPSALTIRPAILVDEYLYNIKGKKPEIYHFRGGQFMGNQSNYASALNISQVNLIPTIHSGDPRSFSDYDLVRFDKADTINSTDSTPAPCTEPGKQTPLGNTAYTALSLGNLGPNSNISLNSTMWRDVPHPDCIEQKQYAVPFSHFQSILASVGQLGHVYDPTKYITSQDVLLYGRGGGRTLNIGQTEGKNDNNDNAYLYDPISRPESRYYAAWRLIDFFTTTSHLYLPGTYNINGILRDGGRTFRKLLERMQFNDANQGDPDRRGYTLSMKITENQANSIYTAFRDYLDASKQSNTINLTPGAFMERGEISEIKLNNVPLFSRSVNVYGNKNMQNLLDRDRESLLRRLAEILCTRGNVFTVYCIAQALAPSSTPTQPIPTATSKMKVTFAIYPVYDDCPPLNNYTPQAPFNMNATILDQLLTENYNPQNQQARYTPPKDYKIKIISSEVY